MDATEAFRKEVEERVHANARDEALVNAATAFVAEAGRAKYTYNFSWLGRPIIQFAEDIVAVQELIWAVKPDLVIETGVAHGGSLVLSASMLALLDLADARAGRPPRAPRRVLGIDIEIRPHNRAALEAHPLFGGIELLEASSTAPEAIARAKALARDASTVMVFLDSNHTRAHVEAELEAYAPLVTPGSYCVVFDTVVEQMSAEAVGARPWGRGNSPATAAAAYLARHPEFEVDAMVDDKLLITATPRGFLRRRA